MTSIANRQTEECGVSHSPLPWRFEEVGGFLYLIDATGKKIATMYGSALMKTLNAELVLESVNAEFAR
jgi:hypothetical protein